MGWGLAICLWLSPLWFNYWFSFTLAHSRIAMSIRLYSIVINLVFMFSLWCIDWVGSLYANRISVLRVASGPRVKLAGYKSTLNPTVVYSTDRSKAVVLVLFLLFIALCSFVVPALRSVFFFICVVMLALWSPSSIAAHLAFCFTSYVVMLAFWSLSTAAHFIFRFTSCD